MIDTKINTQLPSIIDNKNIKETFMMILESYEGDSNQNYKPSLLDMTSFLYWSHEDNIRYKIDKTRNLLGFVRNKKYNIIVYETPKNNSYLQDVRSKIKSFKKLKRKNAIVIVKTGDFRLQDKLMGTFEIQQAFHSEGFFLSDNIIHKNHSNSTFNTMLTPKYKHSEIIHSNFLIFK